MLPARCGIKWLSWIRFVGRHLDWRCRAGHFALFGILCWEFWVSPSCDGPTNVHKAAAASNLSRIETFLENGGDPNSRDSNGITPLGYALNGGHIAAAKLLLASGANPNIGCGLSSLVDASGFEYALALGNRELLDACVCAGASVVPSKHLIAAAVSGNTASIEFLLELGCDVNAMSEVGISALSSACFLSDATVVAFLLKHGAVVNTATYGEGVFNSPVWSCVKSAVDDGACLQLLAEHGADMTVESEARATALHLAAIMGRRAVIPLLVNGGCRAEQRDESGLTAIQYALQRGHLEIAEMLRSGGGAGEVR